jgi:hypothetical protein
MTATRIFAGVTLSLVAASCGDGSTDTGTGPSPVPLSTTQFTNVVEPGQSRFYSFNLAANSFVIVTLASVTNADTGAPLPIALRVGIGRPQGTECPAAAAAAVTAALPCGSRTHDHPRTSRPRRGTRPGGDRMLRRRHTDCAVA